MIINPKLLLSMYATSCAAITCQLSRSLCETQKSLSTWQTSGSVSRIRATYIPVKLTRYLFHAESFAPFSIAPAPSFLRHLHSLWVFSRGPPSATPAAVRSRLTHQDFRYFMHASGVTTRAIISWKLSLFHEIVNILGAADKL